MSIPVSIQKLINTRKTLLSNSETPFLDAVLLLCHTLGVEKEVLYTLFTSCPEPPAVTRYDALIARRASGEPIAYITGEKEFYGLNFQVDSRVLIPRPDSETLVEWVLKSHAHEALSLHDCCTGSGAIAIALKHERPSWPVSASDISIESRDIFLRNCRNCLGSESIRWHQQNILETPQPHSAHPNNLQNLKYHIITANPPYLTDAETAERMQQGWLEPARALNGGKDGLAIIRKLIGQAAGRLLPEGLLYIEAADSQIERIICIFKEEDFTDIECREDLAGMRRVIRGRMSEL